ncbi:MAG: hypothetical protein FJ347_02500 [Sphingomonadales bacterium]|nr:hypothetical protein [Sphingomonadales bacterium]
MGKVRLALSIFGTLMLINVAFSQQVLTADTLPRKSFLNYREAADTLWSKLSHRKKSSLLAYTASDSVYYHMLRKRNPELSDQIMRGLWLTYGYKVDKSYSKVYKQLKKQKISLQRSKKDTVLVSFDAKNAEIMRVEQYFTKGKLQYCLRFMVWNAEGAWYYTGGIDFYEDRTRLR